MDVGKKIVDLSVVVIGEICSGKSTLAKSINFDNSFKIVSFGAFVEDLCIQTNINPTRENKQDLGEKLVRENPYKFLIDATEFAIKNGSTKKVIYEGVRHVSILQAINDISARIKVIYLDYDVDIRYSRFLRREQLENSTENRQYFFEKTNHPVEHEVPLLKKVSGFTTSEEKYDSLLKRVKDFLLN